MILTPKAAKFYYYGKLGSDLVKKKTVVLCYNWFIVSTNSIAPQLKTDESQILGDSKRFP